MSYYIFQDREVSTEPAPTSVEPTAFSWQDHINDSSIDANKAKSLLHIIASQFKPLPPIAVIRFEAGCFGE